jgi:hypothetical protein
LNFVYCYQDVFSHALKPLTIMPIIYFFILASLGSNGGP